MKRVFALVLCFLLLPTAMAEQYVIYHNRPDGYLTDTYLLRDDGTVIAGPENFAEVQEVLSAEEGGPLYAVAKALPGTVEADPEDEGLDLALMDGEGRMLTDFDYHGWIFANREGVIFFYRSDGATGILDKKGILKVFGDYSSLVETGEGRYLALNKSGALLSIDAEGTETPLGLTGDYLDEPLTEGDPIMLIGVREFGNRTIFLDETGKPLTDASYESCSAFENGFAVVQGEPDGGYGLINARGELLLPMEYSDVFLVGEGKDACVVAESADRMGFTLFSVSDMTPRNRVSFGDTGIFSIFVDSPRGDLLTVYLYDEQENLTQQYLDTYGRPRFTDLPKGCSISSYCNRQDALPDRVVLDSEKYDGNYYLLDLDGRKCSEGWKGIDSALWQNGHGRYVVTDYSTKLSETGEEKISYSSWRAGVIDESGKVILEPRYDSVRVLGLDRYWVEEGHRSGMIDGAGHWYFTLDDYASLLD